MTDKEVLAKILELSKMPTEREWFEFKENYSDPQIIGEYISALSNSATLHNMKEAYLVWGIRDSDHALLGTDFDPYSSKVSNQDLIIWLRTSTKPDLNTQFYAIEHEGKRLVMLVIPCAHSRPTHFREQAFVRIGSSKKSLSGVPELEKKLWQNLNKENFEDGFAIRGIDSSKVLSLLDYPAYFDLLEKGLPENKSAIIEALIQDGIVTMESHESYAITNLGAILLAKNLDEFKSLFRKAIRIIVYRGSNRVETIKEQQDKKGYANGFSGAIEFINTLLPMNEIIGQAFRREVKLFPDIAIRELLANALIHQDFAVGGAGPMIEIFSDRIEITNPGTPLIDTKRFLDHSPRSRNENLASFMRRVNICEERGSGIDKVFTAVEAYQLPPPEFQVMDDSTRIILFGLREHSDMSPQERIWACYWHAVLLYENGRKRMTNATLRARLRIGNENYSMASKVIKDALKGELIKLADPDLPKSGYVPFWA